MFTLDNQAAMDLNQSNRLNESGIYFGTITRAEYTDSPNGAGFLNIDFKTDDGKEANYMSLCHRKNDGSRAFGFNIIMAIMACMGVQKTSEVNHNNKRICPELTGKRVGLALQAEADWYWCKKDYKMKQTTNMNIFMPFDPQSKQTAKEKIQQTPAELINKLTVEDKPAKPEPMPTQAQQEMAQANQPYNQSPTSQDNFMNEGWGNDAPPMDVNSYPQGW